jgi:secreted Zn-dependent insulinase-like peptidase
MHPHPPTRQSLMLESDRHHRLDKIAAVASVTPAELRAHLPELLRSLFVDILAHGNMTAAQASEFARTLQVCICVCASATTSG